ncbi:hypothetical protein F183_A36020 [Bryobacterales bacterium F-183]|nr:hypothetical protein F183_A36020 [Bryobacterales bacterium F-183]
MPLWCGGSLAGRQTYDPHPALGRMHPPQDLERVQKEYLAEAPSLIDAMFSAKPALRPIYDQMYDVARGLGTDVKICPAKTIVPLYRTHVFAQIKPTTKTRIDLGLALRPFIEEGRNFPARLIDTGGYVKKDRITHRIEIFSLMDIDDEVLDWLKQAYEWNP